MPDNYTHQDISDYYDQCEVHFRYFWNLEKWMGLHYGVWDKHINSFGESVLNTNEYVSKHIALKQNMHVLDAGCGVGGTSVYLAREYGISTKGITLSAKQVATASENAKKHKVDCGFSIQDYSRTSFADNSFDAAYGLESVSSAFDLNDFIGEMKRVVKPGGRVAMVDLFKGPERSIDLMPDLKIFMGCWAIGDVETEAQAVEKMKAHGFINIEVEDLTPQIKKCAKRMYWAGWLGLVGTKSYNLFRKATPFSRIHYQSGIHQWKSLRKEEWRYLAISGEVT